MMDDGRRFMIPSQVTVEVGDGSEPVIWILNPIGASHLSLLHGFNVQALM